MFQIIGIILLMTGSTGMAWTWCREGKARLEHIKCIRQIYEYLQREMTYAKAALPDICERLSRRQTPFCNAFSEIYKEMNTNNGCSFEEIWYRHMSGCIRDLHLKDREAELLLGLPASLGYRDKEGQAEGLEHYIEEAAAYSMELEAELKNKNKVVMCLGVTGGLMAVILLL